MRLYMPDGQLKSSTIRVYVSGEKQPKTNVVLELRQNTAAGVKFNQNHIAPDQQWTETINGQAVSQTGTLLLFDIRKLPIIEWKAMLRVLPVITWDNDGGGTVVSDTEVNVGNTVAAIGWTVVIVILTTLLITMLAWNSENPLQIFSGPDGHISLAQVQIACWTIAVGSVVLGYGLIRLQIPEIPTSLLVLMGASLMTGGLAYFGETQKDNIELNKATAYVKTAEAKAAAAEAARTKAKWEDLLRVFPSGQFSLAKAQMLFWTILLLVLFVSKTMLDGVIWNVPWPLVALMGFSQASFLAPQLMV
jgi:hypothetical protein